METKISQVDSFKEWDNFLESVKQKEDKDFRIILRGGIEILHNGERVASIWLRNDNFNVLITSERILVKGKGISNREAIEKSKKIWKRLKK